MGVQFDSSLFIYFIWKEYWPSSAREALFWLFFEGVIICVS